MTAAPVCVSFIKDSFTKFQSSGLQSRHRPCLLSAQLTGAAGGAEIPRWHQPGHEEEKERSHTETRLFFGKAQRQEQ